jgi:DNA-binding beta-propeller fold protein YncE
MVPGSGRIDWPFPPFPIQFDCQPPARRNPMTLRRAVLTLSLLLLVAGAVAAAWYFRRPPVPSPTEGEWTAAVSTIAGWGEPGIRDGAASLAQFSDPFAVAVTREGRVYVADGGDSNRIRAIDGGRVFTVAGGHGEGFGDGRGSCARFHTPSGIAVADDATVYVADTGNHRIRRIAADGRVTTVAGSGVPGLRDGGALEAQFNGPIGIAIAAGRPAARPAPTWIGRLLMWLRENRRTAPVDAPAVHLIVADTYNDAIRLVDATGTVTTIAGGSGPGLREGTGPSAQFDTPSGIAVLRDGTALVADTGNSVVRRVTPKGEVTTAEWLPIDANSDVSLYRPTGIAAARDGSFYVTDRRARILQVLRNGHARVLAGGLGGFADGLGPDARFHNPTGIALDRDGALIVADAGNYLLRRVAPPDLDAPQAPRSPLGPTPGLPARSLALRPLPWPVDPQFAWHELAGNMGEARGSLSDARERFHAGIDVHANEGEVVRAVTSDKVSAPFAAQGFDTLSESLSVGPFTYVHVRVGRERKGAPLDEARAPVVVDQAGSPLRARVRRGTRFELGDPIGTVNGFNHVHLNVGTPGREVNPLLLPLVGFVDTVPPTIAHGGIILLNEAGLPIPKAGKQLLIAGRVRIVVDAYDQVNGNVPRRRLGVFRLGYQVLLADGTPAPGFETPRITIDFTRLPQDARAPALVYAAGSGIPVYGTRRTRFLYTVTNTVQDGIAKEGAWDTTTLEPGRYTLRIYAADCAGNEAVKGRDLAVVVAR